MGISQKLQMQLRIGSLSLIWRRGFQTLFESLRKEVAERAVLPEGKRAGDEISLLGGRSEIPASTEVETFAGAQIAVRRRDGKPKIRGQWQKFDGEPKVAEIGHEIRSIEETALEKGEGLDGWAEIGEAAEVAGAAGN